MRKLVQALMLGTALLVPVLPAYAVPEDLGSVVVGPQDKMNEYKGPFSTQALYTMCSDKNPDARVACTAYLQGLMYGLRMQVAKIHNEDGTTAPGMQICLPDDMSTEAARLNLLSFINAITNGNPSSNGDSGDWVAWMSLEGGRACPPPKYDATVAPYGLRGEKGSYVLTSAVEGLTVSKLTVNGGNCTYASPTALPITLKLNEIISFSTSCNATDILIETDVKGQWKNTWPTN